MCWLSWRYHVWDSQDGAQILTLCWLGVCGLRDRLNDGGAFLYLLLLLFFCPFLPFPALLPIPVSPFVILLLGAGDSPGWRITARLDRAAEPRDLSQLISVSLRSSSSGAELDCGRLIFNLLPFNKVRVRLDQFMQARRTRQPCDPPIIQETRNYMFSLSLYFNSNYIKKRVSLLFFLMQLFIFH